MHGYAQHQKRVAVSNIGVFAPRYSDTFEMRTVAFYMARQAETVSWDLGELVASLSDGTAPNLPELRETFLRVLRLGKG